MASGEALLRICMSWVQRKNRSTYPASCKGHVTKERYIHAFDPAVLAAMKSLEDTLGALNQSQVAEGPNAAVC
jgi:hypothetical protein